MKERILTFEEDYFAGETLWRYYVSPYMKRLHAAEMEVLAEIDLTCKKYGIKYSIAYGSLLGAIRHKGVIPWDDDIDISMCREDYERFLEIAEDELIPLPKASGTMYSDWGGKLLYFNARNSKYRHSFTRVVNNNRICVKEDFLEKYHGCPQVAGIDLFPFDYMPEDCDKTDEIYELIRTVSKLLYSAQDENWSEEGKPISNRETEVIDFVKYKTGYEFNNYEDHGNQLAKFIDTYSKLYTKDESKYIMWLDWYARNATATFKPRFDKNSFDEMIEVPFGPMLVPAPKNYEEVLSSLYGEYMTPVNYSEDSALHRNDSLNTLIKEVDWKGKDPMTMIELMVSKYKK